MDDESPSSPSTRRAVVQLLLLALGGVALVWLLNGGTGWLSQRFARTHAAGPAVAGPVAVEPTAPPTPRLHGISPPARTGAALIFDVHEGAQGLLLFGGTTDFRGDRCVPDMWFWSGDQWIQLPTIASLPCVQPHLFNSGTGMILVASRIGSGDLETWMRGKDGTWRRATGAAPTPRRDAALGVDDIGGEVVLFGGLSPKAGQALDDTWTLQGEVWLQLRPVHHLPARSGAVLHAPNGGHLILFGGAGPGGSDLADTWTWSGSDWLELRPAHSPAARNSAAAESLPGDGRLYLTGGFGASNYLRDTWAWTGSDWVAVAGQGPPARRSAAFASGASGGGAALFGGDVGTVPSNDLWTLDQQTQTWSWVLP